VTTNPAPASIAPRLVAALDHAWATIRHHHPEVPEVVITLGSGSLRTPAGRLTLGHFAADRWQHGQGRLPEMFIAGEGLSAGSRDVLGTLLHEAAHGLAHARGIQDTSRQGRYHNARYRDLATELGLQITKVEDIGWSGTHIPDTTAATYAPQLTALDAAIVAWRHTEHSAALTGSGDGEQHTKPAGNNGHAARCECDRRIRIAPTVYAAGPITCGLCDTQFRTDTDTDEGSKS
jgi:hypothetical protein